jgi:hypothetical protein
MLLNRGYIVITGNASGNHVHKVSRPPRPPGVRRQPQGEVLRGGNGREAYKEFVKLVGCFDRKCTTSWDISLLKQQAAAS